MLQKLQPKAIIYGFFVDIGGTIVLTLLVGVIIAVYALLRGGVDEIVVLMESQVAEGFSWFIGGIMSIAGGFYAANKAKYRHLEHGTWVGIVVLVVTLPFVLFGLYRLVQEGMETGALLFEIVITFLWVGFATMGGFLAKQVHAKRSSETADAVHSEVTDRS